MTIAESIEQADLHADQEWRDLAYFIVGNLADVGRWFTADDVAELIDLAGVSTGNPSALGPVFQRAARAGLIVKTGEYRQSRLSRRHRALVVWGPA